MNPKLLVGIIAFLLVVLVTPFLMNALRDDAPVQTAPAPAPAPPPPTAPPPPDPVQEAPPPVADFPMTFQPPERAAPQYERQPAASAREPLTAETLVGTAWEVPTPQGAVMIELGPNGQATASHPLVGQIGGTWNAQGNRVNATVSFMGHTQSVNATIDGSTLKVQGQNIRRLR